MVSRDELLAGSRAAINLLSTKINALITERDNLVAEIERSQEYVRQLVSQKESIEERISELVRLRQRMEKALRDEFGVNPEEIVL